MEPTVVTKTSSSRHAKWVIVVFCIVATVAVLHEVYFSMNLGAANRVSAMPPHEPITSIVSPIGSVHVHVSSLSSPAMPHSQGQVALSTVPTRAQWHLDHDQVRTSTSSPSPPSVSPSSPSDVRVETWCDANFNCHTKPTSGPRRPTEWPAAEWLSSVQCIESHRGPTFATCMYRNLFLVDHRFYFVTRPGLDAYSNRSQIRAVKMSPDDLSLVLGFAGTQSDTDVCVCVCVCVCVNKL
jgi:hypothetical protein